MGTNKTKTPQPTKRSLFNKSAFVREFTSNFSAAEIVKRAKQHGVTISPAYVYNIRATAKKLAKGKPGLPKQNRAALERAGAFDAYSALPAARKPAAIRSALQVNLDAIAMRFVDQLLAAIRGTSLGDLAGA